MGTNSDFQSELLRMNGLLQVSITELRYRCEVYRLSLRSICKVLGNVHKEQEIRLRCLTTSRRSYQAYFLNLIQRQALDSISNVVRKASTFINGYSLLDKELFLPSPPKPRSMYSGPDRRTPTTRTSDMTDGPQLNSPSFNSNPSSGIASTIAETASAAKDFEADRATSASKNNPWENGEQNSEEKVKRERKTCFNSSSRRSHAKYDNGSERKKGYERERTRQRTSTNITQRNHDPRQSPSKSINGHYHQIIINSRQQSHADKVNKAVFERRTESSVRSQSRNRSSLSERKSGTLHGNESLREEARRTNQRLFRERDGNRGSCNKDSQRENERNTGFRAANLREIRENKNQTWHNKAGESLVAARNRTNQGQGVARKQLFSSNKPHNNFKLNFVATEKVRRLQLSMLGEITDHESRKSPPGTGTRNST